MKNVEMWYRGMIVTLLSKNCLQLVRECACKFEFIVEAFCLFCFAFCFPTILCQR